MELKRTRGRRINQLNKVLIVPYGIETMERSEGYLLQRVLIVPYGIET